MELTGNSGAETSAAFLRQMRAKYEGPLIVIWDHGAAHSGDAIRELLATPGLDLRLVRLPASSPDYNGDEAIWKWARDEVTANTCLGTKAKVQEAMAVFFHGLAQRADEVKGRCRTLLQKEVAALVGM
jgi:transposase